MGFKELFTGEDVQKWGLVLTSANMGQKKHSSLAFGGWVSEKTK